MRLLRWLLCAVGLHQAPEGLTRWCVYFECARCGALTPGEWAKKRKTR